MKNDVDWQVIAREEIEFFGAVSASISHEINNRLAVISEKAGLIEDLAMMLAHGKSVEPERFQVQGQKIVEQVRKAKHTVGNLNRFAHSADVPRMRIDAAALLAFVVELYQRKAEMAEVELSGPGSTDPLLITTFPFILKNLIGRCIDGALPRSGENRVVDVSVEPTREGITVRFGGLAGAADTGEIYNAGEGSSALLDRLGARLRREPGGTDLFLDIPDHDTSNQGGEHD